MRKATLFTFHFLKHFIKTCTKLQSKKIVQASTNLESEAISMPEF